MSKPWDKWIPGVLSRRQVKLLFDDDYVSIDPQFAGDLDSRIDLSSFDLSLSDRAYELLNGSVKPFGGRYLNQIMSMGLAKEILPDGQGIFFLKSKTTYLFRLNERITRLKDSPIYGQATAKSSIGRVDVLARLIVDGMQSYEEFSPREIDGGEMFLEVTPITFNVRVKPNTCLSQLRLFKGHPSECEVAGESISRTVLAGPPGDEKDNVGQSILSLDLSTTDVAGTPAVAFFTVGSGGGDDKYIDLWSAGTACAEEFWGRVCADQNNRLKIEPGRFYIMRSAESIRVPKGIAIYCRAIDETIGEMRIHYAGFAHPHFGKRSDAPGTPLVFEVRGHDVTVSLGHRERMARLVFYRMSEDADDIPADGDGYNTQILRLSKFFSDWSGGQ